MEERRRSGVQSNRSLKGVALGKKSEFIVLKKEKLFRLLLWVIWSKNDRHLSKNLGQWVNLFKDKICSL